MIDRVRQISSGRFYALRYSCTLHYSCQRPKTTLSVQAKLLVMNEPQTSHPSRQWKERNSILFYCYFSFKETYSCSSDKLCGNFGRKVYFYKIEENGIIGDTAQFPVGVDDNCSTLCCTCCIASDKSPRKRQWQWWWCSSRIQMQGRFFCTELRHHGTISGNFRIILNSTFTLLPPSSNDCLSSPSHLSMFPGIREQLQYYGLERLYIVMRRDSHHHEPP